METCGTEEPYEGKPHVRICGGAGRVTAGSTRTLEGLLAWAVRGCLAWQREGFSTPAEVTQATQAY